MKPHQKVIFKGNVERKRSKMNELSMRVIIIIIRW